MLFRKDRDSNKDGGIALYGKYAIHYKERRQDIVIKTKLVLGPNQFRKNGGMFYQNSGKGM